MSISQVSGDIRIFFSSAPSDKSLSNKLKKHLRSLKWQGLIDERYNSGESVRDSVEQFIETDIDSANIIVWLISVEFLDSKQIEIQRALELQKAGVVHIIPVLLRPVMLNRLPTDLRGSLPPDGKPVSRWLDKDEALVEVAKGIWKVAKDHLAKLAAARSSSKAQSPLDDIPHWPNQLFTDREALLAALHNYFTPGQITQHTRILALNGLPGVGKTQIAVKYAYEYKNKYQKVVWLKAASREDLSTDIHLRAKLFSLSDSDQMDAQRRFAAVRRWLYDHKEWLLILDNFDNSDDGNLINQLIPPLCSGHVLMTTLDQTTDTRIRAVSVAKMTPDEGALLLLRRVKIIDAQASLEKASEADRQQAESIVQEVDGLPLALDQAGAYVNETGCSLATYYALYRQRSTELLKRRGKSGNDHPDSVAVTINIAFRKIARVHPDALELLYLFACLPPDAIPREMVEQGVPMLDGPLHALAVDPLKLEDAIATLLSFSLIHSRTDTNILSIHRIVQNILIAELAPKQQRQWAMRAVHLVSSVFPEAEFSNWSLCKRYLPQAQSCAELIHKFQPTKREVVYLKEAVDLLDRLGSYYFQRSCYQDAEKYLAQALGLCEQGMGPEHLDTAEVLNSLAMVRHKQGQYQQAEKLYQRALTIREQVLGSDHPEVAPILNNLALVYKNRGHYQQAEKLYLRVRFIDEKTMGPEHTGIVRTLNNLARLYSEQRKYQDAKEMYRQILSIDEPILPAYHPDRAACLNNLAHLYKEQGNYAQAEACYQQALTIRRKSIGPEHLDTARNLSNLANLYEAQEKYQEAEELYLCSLEIYKNMPGEHFEAAKVFNNLAYLSHQQGFLQKAENLYRQALEIYERTPEVEYLEAANMLNNLGWLYHSMKDDKRAEDLLKRALGIRERMLGPEHLDTAVSLNTLGELLMEQQRYEEAEPLFRHLVGIYQMTLGPSHPDVAIALKKRKVALERIKEQKKS